MHSLLECKIDEATIWLLKRPEHNINQETLNLQCVTKSKNFTVCIWGNTAKNPRVKSVEFATEGFTIEIPKSLVLENVAVRLLHKYYDNFSPQCATFLPKIKHVVESEQKIEIIEMAEKVSTSNSIKPPLY